MVDDNYSYSYFFILFSKLYSKTNGLVDANNSEYVSSHMTSDSNDNICIESGVIIAIPFLFYILSIKKRIKTFEYIIGNITLLIQVFLIIAIDGGSIIKTIQIGNTVLFVWCITYCLLCIELHVSFIYEHMTIHKLNKNLLEHDSHK